MKTSFLIGSVVLLSMAVLPFAQMQASDPPVDDSQLHELRRAFLGFYMGVGAARAATDPADVVKVGGAFWHLPDDKARQSLNDFGAWLLAAKPSDIAVEKVKTAGDLARLTVFFAHVGEPYPSHAEVTLVRPGEEWKIVNCRFLKNESVPESPSTDQSLPEPGGDSARETLDRYLKMLSNLADEPDVQNNNPQALVESLSEWWVDDPQRNQVRAMTQGAMFFRLYQPKEWKIDPVGSVTKASATFSVRVQPGNEISRRLGPQNLTFGLERTDPSSWKISSFTNPNLTSAK